MENSHLTDTFPIEELFVAYYDARRHKRNSSSQLRFELHLEENLIELYRDICSRRYTIGTSICFTINDSVKREVFAADFRDRVVHHFLYNRISPFFEKKFIYDSYSCRKGKGTLFGIKRLQHHIRSCSRNYSRDCYVLKLDLTGYFMNIDRSVLYAVIDSSLPHDFPQRDFIMWLTYEIVMYEPIINCRIKGRSSDWEDLPSGKSLFYSEEGKGMPIGNLTSQLFSNIYLNQFDWWMKRVVGCRHYGRYVDDFYVVHESKEYLTSLIPVISTYLGRELELTLHPRKIYLQHHCKGVRFLGAVVLPYRIVPAKRLRTKMARMFMTAESGILHPYELRAKINSYLGIMSHFSSFCLIERSLIQASIPYMHGYFSHKSSSYRYSLY